MFRIFSLIFFFLLVMVGEYMEYGVGFAFEFALIIEIAKIKALVLEFKFKSFISFKCFLSRNLKCFHIN